MPRAIAQLSRFSGGADPARRGAADGAGFHRSARPLEARLRADLFGGVRAERKARSGSVVDSDPDRYRRFTDAGLGEAGESGQLAPSSAGRKIAVGAAPDQGQRHLSPAARNISPGRSTGMPGPRSSSNPGRNAAPAGRDQPAAAAPPVRCGSLSGRAKAEATAGASAPTVNGLRSNS